MTLSRTAPRRFRFATAAGCVLVCVTLAGLSGCTGSDDGSPADASSGETATTDADPTSSGAPSTPDVTSNMPSVSVGKVVPAALKPAVSQPVEDPYYPETSNPEVDVLRYLLQLGYTAAPRLDATATVTFRATRDTGRVRLDLGQALHVSGVRLDDRPAAYRHVDDGLITRTPGMQRNTVHTLTIRYAGVPEPAPADIQRFESKPGLGWQTESPGIVFTFQEPYGAGSWFPSNDHPSDEAFFDASVTTDIGDIGVFNGTLRQQITSGGETTTRWHLDEPAATYLITLAIGPYHEYTALTESGMELSFWLMNRDKHYLPTLRRQAVDAFDWLVDHAGPYPFDSLGFVVVGGGDAMETQTMVTLSRSVFQRSDAVIQHEIAHQWYGDSVSPVDWKGLWINEGWAMYMQHWYEEDRGGYTFAGGWSQWRSLDNESRQVAGPPANYDPRYFGDLNAYLGPAMMLDQIRQQIGDDAFADFVKDWAADHAGQNVDRDDFTAWAEQTTGEDLGPLIDRWLDSPTTPPL